MSNFKDLFSAAIGGAGSAALSGLFDNAIDAAFDGAIGYRQREAERQRALYEQAAAAQRQRQYQKTVECITKLERGDDTIRITIAPAYGEGRDLTQHGGSIRIEDEPQRLISKGGDG